MLYSEFLKGTRAPETPDTYDQFQIIGQIYEDCEGMTKEEAYRIWKQTYGRELKRRELRQRERLELLINREDYDSADRPHRAAIYHELSTLFWAAYYNKDGSRCRLATEGRCFTDVYGITWILRYDGRYPNGNTIFTVVPVCLYQWVGKQHSKVRDMLPKIIRYWGAIGGVCDGTGIGEPLAYHLKELFDRNNDGLVEAYKFKAAGDESKSKLGYLAYDFNHNDLIKVPKAPEDPDQLELWKELRWQVEHLTREAKRQQTINFYVPANAEPRKPGHVPHDDLVMALFLLMRAARNIDPNTGKATAFDREKSGV